MHPERGASRHLEGHAKGRVPRALRERQILEAAESVFAEYGYDGTSLEEIARATGVTRQYLGKLFGDKGALYLRCHAQARVQLDEMLTQAGSGIATVTEFDDLIEIVRACVAAYFDFVEQHDAGWDVLFGSGAAVAGSIAADVGRLRLETVDVLGELIAAALPEADEHRVRMAALAASGSAEMLAKWWRGSKPTSKDEVIDLLTQFVWNGLIATLRPS